MCSLMQIKGSGGAAVGFPHGQGHAVYLALADLDGHPGIGLSYLLSSVEAVLLGRSDSPSAVCGRASVVPASQ